MGALEMSTKQWKSATGLSPRSSRIQPKQSMMTWSNPKTKQQKRSPLLNLLNQMQVVTSQYLNGFQRCLPSCLDQKLKWMWDPSKKQAELTAKPLDLCDDSGSSSDSDLEEAPGARGGF